MNPQAVHAERKLFKPHAVPPRASRASLYILGHDENGPPLLPPGASPELPAFLVVSDDEDVAFAHAKRGKRGQRTVDESPTDSLSPAGPGDGAMMEVSPTTVVASKHNTDEGSDGRLRNEAQSRIPRQEVFHISSGVGRAQTDSLACLP